MPYAWPPTVTELKTETNITSSTDDAELQTVLDAAVALLENHPAYRVKDAVTTTTYTEWYDGGNDTIVLKHYPVSSVTSVAEYTPTVQALADEEPDVVSSFTGYGYTIDKASGIVTRTSGGVDWRFSGRVKVVYVAGSATVPADLRLAGLLLAEHMWQTQRGEQAGGSLPSGLEADLDSAALGNQFGPAFILPNRVRELLEPYQRAPAVA